MPKVRKNVTEVPDKPRLRPASTPEARENQLISLAIDLAEKQLIEGTASAQVITHYLKLGTMRERSERERLELEKELLKAKTKALNSEEEMEQKYERVMAAMRRYNGINEGIDDEY